jgi:hypothetical protein
MFVYAWLSKLQLPHLRSVGATSLIGLALKILFLSFYYYPDLCAGSFRAAPLLEALLNNIPKNTYIDIVTTHPNRYSSYQTESLDHEAYQNHSITRVQLPNHDSGVFDQARAFLYYANGVRKYIKDKEYDLVLATSSRLMTASLGAWCARKLGAPLYLDIRDIFVDTISDVFPKKISTFVAPIFSFIEKSTFRRATKINLVSKGFAGYFGGRYPQKYLSFFTNGIDEIFLHESETTSDPETTSEAINPIKILYAGNMGEGQGLHKIIPALAAHLGSAYKFTLIGDGGRRAALEAELKAHHCTNVEILPPQNRTTLIESYRQADVLFLHLNDYPAFEKVLPSKLFEYAAMNKPIWAGLAGYPASFVKSEISNAAVFTPCDLNLAVSSFASLRLQTTIRSDFIAQYKRSAIMDAMAKEVVTLLNRSPDPNKDDYA